MRFWDGQPLRYTLKKKNKEVDQELMVIEFMLVPAEEVEEEERKWKERANQSPAEGSTKQEKLSQDHKQDASKSQSFKDDDVD